MRDLATGPRRFVELQRVLPGISTEQLRSRLNRMVADGLLTRQRYREVPPRVDYELTDRSRDLLPVIGALARWGFRWAWGPPHAAETVDIGAILRLSPGMLAPPRGLSGTVEVHAPGKDGAPRTHLLHVHEGAVSISEAASDAPDARIAGNEEAWIAAFGPAGSRAGLEVSGDARLADELLSGLSATVERISAAA